MGSTRGKVDFATAAAVADFRGRMADFDSLRFAGGARLLEGLCVEEKGG